MIINDIKIFSQNVQKNNLIVNTIFESKFDFDIIFIQEPSWTTIYSIFSSSNWDRDVLVGTPNHPNWLMFSRTSEDTYNFPRVVAYIDIRLKSFCFSLWKDIINHRDILLKYLKDTKVNIYNVLIMMGDFNICNSL